MASFQLTEGDIEIIKHIFNHRLLTVDHLAALTNRWSSRLRQRLPQLVNRHYLYRIENPTQKYLYLIGRESVPILVERGIASKELIEWRMRHHELKDLFLKHLLMISDIHTALEIATRESHIKLIHWKQGKELNDSVVIHEDGVKQKLPIQPDAFFILQDTARPEGKNKSYFFLEADRSTTTHQRFQRKIKAYWNYFQQGGHKKKHNIEIFRVVTITLTKERAENLCEAVQDILPTAAKDFYFFSPITNFSLTNPKPILEDIFITPKDYKENKRYYFIKPLVAPQTNLVD